MKMLNRVANKFEAHIYIWLNRTIILVGFMLLAFLSASYASNARGQSTQDKQVQSEKQLALNQKKTASQQKVSLELNNEPFILALHKLAKKVNVGFSFQEYAIPDKKVTVNLSDVPIYEALDILLEGTNLEAALAPDRDILIIREKLSQDLKTQIETVTGTVTDAESGETLPGVNVMVKGTTTGTSTNSEGNYELDAPSLQDTLIFSFVGYQTQEAPISGRTTVDVEIQSEAIAGEEVVVVGYGQQRKRDLTGSVSTVKIDRVERSPNTNIGQSLQGLEPGLNIGQVTSAGATPDISIRGTSTIAGNSDVLIILDGIQYNGSLSSINPNDIASIDVLKDASATAVYGAQAANGVILITTKEGRESQGPEISFSSSYATQTPTQDLHPMGREAYLEHIQKLHWDQAYTQESGYTEPNPDFDLVSKVDASMKDENGDLLDNNFNWWDEATDVGYVNENKLSLSGGSENTSYLVSLGLTDQSGFIINDKFKRKSIRVNLDSDVTDWWNIGIQSFGSFVNQDGAEPDMGEIVRQSPLLVPYDEDGNLIPNPFNTIEQNPFMTYDVDDYERHNYLFAKIYSEIEFPFLEGLSYQLNFGNNYRNDEYFRASQYGAGLTGEAYKNHDKYYDYTLDNILTYQNSFQMHDMKATLLYGRVERQATSTDASANGFNRLTLGYNSLEQGTNQYTNSGAWSENLEYQMARMNYKYDSKYLVTATLRRDGFSGFAANYKYGLFPSAAVGWVLTEESFFDVEGIENLKVRVGYGISGNQTSRYSSLANVDTRSAYVFGDGGATKFGQELRSLANNDLQWEKTKGLNIGIDYSLFADRISGTVDYYENTTRDLLFDVSIPEISGFSSINTNLGRLQNRGIEVSVTSQNIQSNGFNWSTTVNFSKNNNEILELVGLDTNDDGVEDDLVTSGLFIGESLGAIYGYEPERMYQVGDDIPDGYYPGTYKIVDQNGDGEVTPDDRVILGKEEPAYRFSIFNEFSYKRLTLSVFLNAIQGGNKSYLGSNNAGQRRTDYNIRFNQLSGTDYWTPLNPDGTYSISANSPVHSPGIYQDRSFIRLQDVSLSYNFSPEMLNALRISNLRLYVSGKNLFTWTDWEGWDPETGQGLTNNGRPVMKGYTLGFNINF